MPAFCVSITFLDPVPAFHGRGDADKPEWPPSPLRMFQALVAAAASRWRGQQFKDHARPALAWLQKQSPPLIVAPAHHVGVPVRIAVPNNDLDVVATAWAKRQEPKKQPSELKTMKTVRPTRLLLPHPQPECGHVHYVFHLTDAGCPHLDVLAAAARSITHLGWGMDMVAGNASIISEEEAADLPGDRWRPMEDASAYGYRVPTKETLDDLLTKHEAFLNRLGQDGFNPVQPLTAYLVVGYRRAGPNRPRVRSPRSRYGNRSMKSPICRQGKVGSVRSTPCVGSLTLPAWSVVPPPRPPDVPAGMRHESSLSSSVTVTETTDKRRLTTG